MRPISHRSLRGRAAIPAVVCVLAVALWAGCADDATDLTGPAASAPELARSGPPPRLQEVDLGPALRAQARHTARLRKIEGVLGTGVTVDDEGTPTLRVYLAKGGARGIPDRLDDVPVQVRVTGLLMADADPTTKARPAPVGFSVGHYAITAGTIGARVLDGSGAVHILSNNHVLANSNDASPGDAILQPGPFDGGTNPADRIGSLADFEPIDFTVGLTTPPNIMDAAIAQVADADLLASTPLDDGYGFPSAVPLGGSPLGVAVKKYGRTTGLTHGQVTAVNVTVNVCYEALLGIFCLKSADYRDQIEVQASQGAFSGGGDSGSLIVTESGNQPVALLFAGSDVSTIGSPISPILSRFGVTVDDGSGGGGGGGPIAPSAFFTSSCDDASLTCTFDASGSSDDGTIVSYDWDFGDGSTGSGASANHTYASAGTYDVTLTVTDDESLTDSDTQPVTLSTVSGDPLLSGSATKARGEAAAALSWENVPWPTVYVWRDDPNVIATVIAQVPGSADGTGSYTDLLGLKGRDAKGVTHTYFICETDSDLFGACSNWVTLDW